MHAHALAIDVRDFQVGQLGASHSGGVERHQQRAMERSASGIDESCHFFVGEERWNVLGSFRIEGLGCAPAFLESLGIEEPQSREIYRNGARCQLALLEQFRLVFANLLGAQTVWRTLEASREIFHYTDVTAYGSFGVITTLEFVQHHFSEMGHGNTSCDPHLHQTVEQPTLHYLTRSVRRRAAAFKSACRKLGGATGPLATFSPNPVSGPRSADPSRPKYLPSTISARHRTRDSVLVFSALPGERSACGRRRGPPSISHR